MYRKVRFISWKVHRMMLITWPMMKLIAFFWPMWHWFLFYQCIIDNFLDQCGLDYFFERCDVDCFFDRCDVNYFFLSMWQWLLLWPMMTLIAFFWPMWHWFLFYQWIIDNFLDQCGLDYFFDRCNVNYFFLSMWLWLLLWPMMTLITFVLTNVTLIFFYESNYSPSNYG